MLRAAIGFFLVGLLAYALGAYNIAGISLDIGKLLLFIFIGLSVLSLLINVFNGKKINR
jgi:uncharacterized membrane protein YtjA (UPF0391 family)